MIIYIERSWTVTVPHQKHSFHDSQSRFKNSKVHAQASFQPVDVDTPALRHGSQDGFMSRLQTTLCTAIIDEVERHIDHDVLIDVLVHDLHRALDSEFQIYGKMQDKVISNTPYQCKISFEILQCSSPQKTARRHREFPFDVANKSIHHTVFKPWIVSLQKDRRLVWLWYANESRPL